MGRKNCDLFLLCPVVTYFIRLALINFILELHLFLLRIDWNDTTPIIILINGLHEVYHGKSF